MSDLQQRLAQLSPEKRKLLEARLRMFQGEPSRASIPRRGLTEAPLSHAQERLWVVEKLGTSPGVYTMLYLLRMDGRLDAGALRRALEEIVRRHESLRTVFVARDGGAVQRVLPPAPLPLEPEPAAGEAGVRRVTAEEAERPFDLESGPLLRARLLRLTGDRHVLLLSMHHVVSDGWSMGVLLEELYALYANLSRGEPSPLEPLPVQYADYALWQREAARAAELEPQLAYWKRALEGVSPVLEIPGDRPRPAVQSHRGGTHRFNLDAAVAGRLRALADGAGATSFMLYQAAFQLLLSRYTGRDDFLLGTPVAQRSRPELQRLAGFFVNTLALRADLSGEPTFRGLLERVRDRTLEAFAHPDLPFERVVEEVNPERDPGRTPLVQVVFAVRDALPAYDGPGLRVRAEEVATGTAKFDLTLEIAGEGDGAYGTLEYAAALFEPETIARMAGHFRVLLERIAADPDRRVSELPLLTGPEREQVLGRWAGAGTPGHSWCPVHEAVRARAEQAPHALAVASSGGTLTYAELERRATALARDLHARGVGPESRVALFAGRSTELLVGALAVLKAGAAYVPIDPETPGERIAFILSDTAAPVLLTQESLLPRLPRACPATILLDGPRTARGDDGPIPVAVHAESLAYVIYTSGSTGEPKGVEVTHAALGNLVRWHLDAFGITPEDRASQLAGLGFDASVWEIWPYLAAGASVHLVDDEGTRTSPAALRDFLLAREITTAFLPTPLAEAVLPLDWPARAPLRTVLTGGDALRARPRAGLPFALVNNYGPTESTVVATSGSVPADGEESVPAIGRPIAGVRAYVLDRHLEPVPVGVPGELYLGGAGLARGYLNHPELTARSFGPNPFGDAPGERLYRTGDRVRWRRDGELEFLGRVDRQVKVRGFRIEPGEIEAVLLRHPRVADAAVVLREDVPGAPRLVAYLVPSAGETVTDPELRDHLRERLPEYMVPGALVPLDALPLTPNGKVDRKALPAPAAEVPGTAGAPRTPTEEILAGVFAEVLGAGRVGTRDNFFARGGHSLRATQVVARLRGLLGVELPVRVLFEAPTVSALAGRVEDALRAGARAATPAIRAVERTGPLPLSFAQEGVWFLEQVQPGSPTYNVPLVLRLRGPLSVEALERSLGALVARHESLRTTLQARDGAPVQVVHPPAGFTLPVEPVGGGDPDGLQAAIFDEATRPFDLEAGPLFRTRLLSVTAEEHVLVLVMHHAVSDGWSTGILLGELGALYSALVRGEPSPLRPLPVQYGDYVVWQREHFGAEALEAPLRYWREHLAGAPGVLELPTDRPRPAAQSFRGGVHRFALPGELGESLAGLARREGATLYMVLLAAFQVLLSRYSGEEDVVVGTPLAGRTRAELEGVVGFFVNVLPVRARLAGEPAFRDLLAAVREVSLGAHAHQELPLDRLVESLQVPRDPGRHPLFQVVFALQNARAAPPEMAGVEVHAEEVATGTSKFDLTLFVEEREDGLAGALEYATDLFDAATMERLAGHFRVLLAGIVSDPGRSVAELPLLGGEEREQLRAGWTASHTPRPGGPLVPQRVRAHAGVRGGDVAVSSRDGGFTYRELVSGANRLARYLGARGVGPESRVGIFLERSPEAILAQLAVLTAGAAYVPIDPAYPAERIAAILTDSGAPVLLTDSRLLGRLPEHRPATVLLDADRRSIAGESDAPLGVELHPENTAYVIFTSGSTGRPKGVEVTHGALLNLVEWHLEHAGVTHRDRASQFAGHGFDASVIEIWPYLCAGGSVYVIEDELRVSPAAVRDRLVAEGIHFAYVPTPLAESFLSLDWPADAPLRALLTGGDALRARPRPELSFELIDNYGPTETTVVALAARVRPDGGGRAPTIGRPVANVEAYVLDRRMSPVPVGVPGELYLGGAGLARGYLNRPELTARSFVPNPFAARPGERLYRTGDRVRLLPDGEMEFLGRLDHQVKIRGFRIEPGEIESVLLRHPSVAEAVVEARETGPGERQLVAYFVPGRGGAVSPGALRAHLRERLPEYMVPAALVPLEALPLTPNGKVDRKALPAPVRETGSAPEAPRTLTEEILAGIFSRVLRVEQIGTSDDFFALGGHSLLATQVVSRVRWALGVELPVRALFEAPTVGRLAGRVDAASRTAAADAVPPIEPAPRDAPLPLSFAQERLWFLEQMRGGDGAYAVPVLLRLAGVLDAAVLRRALEEIVRRHEALRTTFSLVDGRPVQVVHAPGDLPLDFEPAPAHSASDAAAWVRGEMLRPFDLERELPVRASLLPLAEDEHFLLLCMHHVASDGWSVGVLLRELGELYAAFAAGEPSRLDPLPVQYADYALWQRSHQAAAVFPRQLAYWREQMKGAPPVLELPTDRPRPVVQSFRAGTHSFAVPAPVVARLRAVSREQGATLFMTLLAGFDLLLSCYSGQDELVVGTPVANRTRREVEGLIGFFVNTLVLRADLAGNPSFEALVRRVREAALEAYAHQDLPFERLVEELQPTRELSRNPLFQVMFVLQNTPMEAAAAGGLVLELREVESVASKFDLTLALAERDGGLAAVVEYAADLFDAETIGRMAGHFATLLDAVGSAPEAPLSSYSLLGAGERAHLLSLAKADPEPSTAAGCLHTLFRARAAEHGHSAAVTCGAESLTYAELEVRSNRLAHLLREMGVGPEVRVGLCLERGPEMVVAILAVLKAGGAYVPLDPEYPAERLAYLLEDSGVPVLLAQEEVAGRLPRHGARMLLPDRDAARIAAQPSHAPESAATPENLAYVIYTSGSTGRPKGVEVTHASVVRLFTASEERFGFSSGDVWTMFHSYAFDFSVWELWGALLYGGRLVVVPYATSRHPEAFHRLLAAERVTVLNQTPSAFRQLAQADLASGLPADALALRCVVFGGEALEPGSLREWVRKHGDERPRLVNMYGITETTVHVTYRPITRADVAAGFGSPIGMPIPDLTVQLLDRDLRPVPIGVPGEMYVGGAGVARGYLGRPDLTAARFVPDALRATPGARLYASGDRARRRPDGELEYLGRADEQVKVRGFRIEPGEIEAALRAHPAVREAAVVVREDRPGDRRLVGYVAASGEDAPDPRELRQALARTLPDHMVPSAIVVLDALPLTRHGKLDRRALPAPSVEPRGASAAPRSRTEQAIAAMWCDVLGLGEVGVHDNFFELGGHSLLLVQAHRALRESLGREIDIVDLFRFPTVHALAQRLDAGDGEAADRPPGEGRAAVRRRLMTRQRGSRE